MDQPTLTDYAHLIMTLYDKFSQSNPIVLHYQNLCTYKYRELIVFFMLMQCRRIYEFKARKRWLEVHPEIMTLLSFETVPHRTTLSRRYKKAPFILNQLQATSLTADDRNTKAMRIRNWIKQDTILITPALRWLNGRYAQAYHQFLAEAESQRHLKKRKTSVEPLFDLIAKVIGATGPQKQLPVQKLVNVRTVLALGAFTVQISMIMNSIWGRPLREISAIKAAFS
ncbi:MAG: hypothetical protein ACK2U0_16825 [Candidatus Promineifilaceae bacterium]|jgi:hypothetical protein